MMSRLIMAVAMAFLVVGAANASPYWISYDPATGKFTEEDGWERVVSPPAAERWIEDGALVIDSSASWDTQDYYRRAFSDGGLDPSPGETFVMQWRLLIASSIPWDDPGVRVTSEDLFSAGFLFYYDHLEAWSDPGRIASFAPGVAHAYELRSADMRTYELAIDGVLTLSGTFVQYAAFPPPRVLWGDVTQGGASLTRWESFEFGVVPEPRAWTGALVALSLTKALLRARWPSHGTMGK
jgi:hypothetical protein